MEVNIELDPHARTFLVCAIALAYPVGMAGFELGAYGELFYDRKIAAWCTVTGALVALLLLPRRFAPVSRWHYLFLTIPSLWILLATAIGSHSGGEIVRPVLFWLGLLSYLLCLPYAIFLIVEIINPDFLALGGLKPKMRLVLIGLFFFGAGFITGARNDLLLTCDDFEIAGDTPPENCRPAPR